MSPIEDNTHVFLVRLWWELREIDGAPKMLRGIIEHVPTRKRHAVKDLGDITVFIAPYLGLPVCDASGRRLGSWLRWRKWFWRGRP